MYHICCLFLFLEIASLADGYRHVLTADEGAEYDEVIDINLSEVSDLICPKNKCAKGERLGPFFQKDLVHKLSTNMKTVQSNINWLCVNSAQLCANMAEGLLDCFFQIKAWPLLFPLSE